MKIVKASISGVLLGAISLGAEAKQLNTTILAIPPNFSVSCNVTNLHKTKTVTVHASIVKLDGTIDSESDKLLAPGTSDGIALAISPSFRYARCSFSFPGKYAGSILAALTLLNSSGEPTSTLIAK